MFYLCLPNGMFDSNCYIISKDGVGVIIDAGVAVDNIVQIINESNLKIEYIFLTHGHVDHICELNDLYRQTGAKVLIHENDKDALLNSVTNLSAIVANPFVFTGEFDILKDGEIISAGGINFQIIHTPGHTQGSMCIKAENTVFTGDTLFKMCVGRTDLPGGDHNKLIDSINKLMDLSDDTVVCPGHGDKSTIGYEKINNRFLK